jgi:hypothetical protein
MSTMRPVMIVLRPWMIVLCSLGVAGQTMADAAATVPPPVVVEGPAAQAAAASAAKYCGAPHTPGPHLCSLIIRSIGIEVGGPGSPAELVATVAEPVPRCYHAPAPGTAPNVAGMTRRLLKSWRGHKPILLDSYYPDDKSQSCDWLVRDQLPCPPTGAQSDPPCVIQPTEARYDSGQPLVGRKPAVNLSEKCEDPKQETQFCSGFIASIEPVVNSDSFTVHLEKPAICVTIDPAADQTGLKIWQSKLELARAAKEEHLQAVVLFPTTPKAPPDACPALYQIDIQ